MSASNSMVPASAIQLSFALVFEGAELRVVGTQDRIEWVAQDVCKFMGLGMPANVMRDFDEDEKGVQILHTLGGPQEMLTVTESGFYRLVFASGKSEAVRLRKRITGEVMPSIHRWGCYPPPSRPVARLRGVSSENMLEKLKAAGPQGMTRTEIHGTFGNNQTAEKIGEALSILRNSGNARSERPKTGKPGPPTERWFAVPQ